MLRGMGRGGTGGPSRGIGGPSRRSGVATGGGTSAPVALGIAFALALPDGDADADADADAAIGGDELADRAGSPTLADGCSLGTAVSSSLGSTGCGPSRCAPSGWLTSLEQPMTDAVGAASAMPPSTSTRKSRSSFTPQGYATHAPAVPSRGRPARSPGARLSRP